MIQIKKLVGFNFFLRKYRMGKSSIKKTKVEYAEHQAKEVYETVKNIYKEHGTDPGRKVSELIKAMENMNSNIDIKQLQTYNTLLAVLHASLGAGFALYFDKLKKDYGSDNSLVLDTDIRRHNVNIEIVPNDSDPPDINNFTLTWTSDIIKNSPSVKTVETLVILFFFVTSGFHAFYAANINGSYEKVIANKNNWYRWVEYSISSTLMLYIIAILSGVKDENVYRSIFAINIAMIYTGQLVEEYAEDEIEFLGKKVPKWTIPMTLGFVLLLTEFGIIIRDSNKNFEIFDKYIAKYSEYENSTDPDEQAKYKVYLYYSEIFIIPDWIKYIIYGLFAFFSVFGAISFVGVYKKQPYERVEKNYLLLSLLSKAFLGSMVAYGLTERKKAASNVADGIIPTKSIVNESNNVEKLLTENGFSTAYINPFLERDEKNGTM